MSLSSFQGPKGAKRDQLPQLSTPLNPKTEALNPKPETLKPKP